MSDLIKENVHYFILDDLIDESFLSDLDLRLSNFWGASLYKYNSDVFKIQNNVPNNVQGLYYFIENEVRNILQRDFMLMSIDLNAQSLGQDGTYHRDTYMEKFPHLDYKNDYTVMVFLNSTWKDGWGGEFQFSEKGDSNVPPLKSIDYIPGRIILFRGDIPHRGLGPKVKKVVRKSLVFRLGVK
jgi:hypothetical protein